MPIRGFCAFRRRAASRGNRPPGRSCHCIGGRRLERLGVPPDIPFVGGASCCIARSPGSRMRMARAGAHPCSTSLINSWRSYRSSRATRPASGSGTPAWMSCVRRHSSAVSRSRRLLCVVSLLCAVARLFADRRRMDWSVRPTGSRRRACGLNGSRHGGGRARRRNRARPPSPLAAAVALDFDLGESRDAVERRALGVLLPSRRRGPRAG